MLVSSDLNSDYVPINCAFHDRLEDYAIRGSVVPICLIENDTKIEIDARIKDVFAKNGADFAKLELMDGTEKLIRLDRLLTVNGFELPTSC